MPRGVVLELAQLGGAQPVADPVPVQRDHVAAHEPTEETFPGAGTLRRLGDRVAERQDPAVPQQRSRAYDGLVTKDALDRAPPDPAAVEHVERRGRLAVVAEQANPWVDLEDVEAVVRHPAGHHALGEVRELVSGPGPEPVLHRVSDVHRADAVEQRAPDPVRLDHATVQRVWDSGGTCDELQVRPGPVEAFGQVDQPGVGHAGSAVLEQRQMVGWPAVAEHVRGIGVSGEQLGAVHPTQLRDRHQGHG
jgi:hypothetical protein